MVIKQVENAAPHKTAWVREANFWARAHPNRFQEVDEPQELKGEE